MELLIGIVIGYLLCKFISWPISTLTNMEAVREEEKKVSLIAKQATEKEANKQKLLAEFETRESLTNDQVERLLGVSDATATRYLEELEREGVVRQVGSTGRGVFYEKNAS